MASPKATTELSVAEVAIDARTGGREAVYTYWAPAGSKPGDAVLAPLGPRLVLGFIRSIRRAEELDSVSLERLKPIESIVEGLGLPDSVLQLVEYASNEYLCSFSTALSAASPPGAIDGMVDTWQAIEACFEVAELSALQSEVWEGLRANGPIDHSRKKPIESKLIKALKLLAAKGLVEKRTTFAWSSGAKSSAPMFRAIADSVRIEEFLKEQAKKRPAQALTLLRMQELGEAALTTPDIKSLCGVTDSTIKQLVATGLLERAEDGEIRIGKAPEPNRDQQLAIDAISECVRERTPSSFLLFGVTGSGKTEVYMRAAAEAVRLGRKVLYLTPEIALATQAVKQLRERFGRTVAILHSELAAGERAANWAAIRRGESAIVLGARSAVFAPLDDIGLIVMDEEHESSYKQETSPRYHTKRLAKFLSQVHRCPLVLGSATPSFESFYEAEQEQHILLSLPSRAAQASMPTVQIEDLGEGYRQSRPSVFSDALLEAMKSTLERREQTILFLNRRSYAPFMICRDCGRQFACPNCSVSLTFSRKFGRLRCHHCGYSQIPPESCPECNGIRLNPFGVGTEKVEEQVVAAFPEARVARLDRDIAKRKGELERILATFGSGEIDILVGTQMVAKGLNFPNVTLVGVIAADMSLNMPDFRAAERTFQLLGQVAGRSGRGAKPGESILQTFNPGHSAIQAAQSHDFLAAYESLIEERRENGYPPFRRLFNIIASSQDQGLANATLADLAKELRAQFGDEIDLLGPTDCAIERLNSLWRAHVLIKAPFEFEASRLAPLLAALERPGVQVVPDVDAYSMM